MGFFFPLSPSPFLFFFFFFISAIYLLFLTGLTKCWKRGMFLPPRQVAAHTQAPVSYYRLHSLCYERFLLSGVEMSKRFSAQLQKPVGLFFFIIRLQNVEKKKTWQFKTRKKRLKKKILCLPNQVWPASLNQETINRCYFLFYFFCEFCVCQFVKRTSDRDVFFYPCKTKVHSFCRLPPAWTNIPVHYSVVI